MIELISGIRNTASALTAERIRMDVISQNIANANVTQGPDGQPYRRQQVVFKTLLDQAQAGPGSGGVSVAKVETSDRPFRTVYNPGHPEADAEGMVRLPNINIHEEMVDLISASRAFEANLAVIKTARSMAVRTLSIGKK